MKLAESPINYFIVYHVFGILTNKYYLLAWQMQEELLELKMFASKERFVISLRHIQYQEKLLEV